jgi:hypothetical protein
MPIPARGKPSRRTTCAQPSTSPNQPINSPVHAPTKPAQRLLCRSHARSSPCPVQPVPDQALDRQILWSYDKFNFCHAQSMPCESQSIPGKPGPDHPIRAQPSRDHPIPPHSMPSPDHANPGPRPLHFPTKSRDQITPAPGKAHRHAQTTLKLRLSHA